MNSFDTPGELVRRYQRRTKKRFGQHFLVDPHILHAIADVAEVGEGDRVLEIGPGCGTLTVTLLERGARVLAVELDRDLVAYLGEQLGDEPNLRLVEGDFLSQDVESLLDQAEQAEQAGAGGWKCAANLPYNVATEVFFRLAEVMGRFECLALMFQREVADRMVARAGDDDFSVLSLMCRLYADAEVALTLPPGAFSPPPKVHSSVVRFVPVPGTRIPDGTTRANFRHVVRQAFQTRRKTLPNALKSTGVDKPRLKEAIAAVGLDLRIRPERVSFEEFEALAVELGEDLED